MEYISICSKFYKEIQFQSKLFKINLTLTYQWKKEHKKGEHGGWGWDGMGVGTESPLVKGCWVKKLHCIYMSKFNLINLY